VVIKRQERRAARLWAENTVKAIAGVWYAELASHESEAWRKQTRGWLDGKIFPSMGSSPVADVQPADVLALCKGIAATPSRHQARREAAAAQHGTYHYS